MPHRTLGGLARPRSDSPERLTELVEALRRNAPTAPGVEAHLHSVITDAAAHPGRLVRARLVDLAARTHGLAAADAEHLACAVEFLHLASLLIDDLPCMDDATHRRGRPCAHRVHGEASTILAALAFINRAYALANLSFARQSAEIRVAAIACLDSCLGTAGLVGGQALDLRFAESPGTARNVSTVALRKTASLFWLAVLLPALPATPSARELHLLKALCIYWGLAYQAADDLADLIGAAATTGKTPGRDRALSRPNLAVALGVPATRHRVARLSAVANQAISTLIGSHPRWSYLIAFHEHVVPSPAGALVNAA